MKSIHEMWLEYAKNNQHNMKLMPFIEIQSIRKAFYAGFNRCYNIALDYNEKSVSPIFCIPELEAEMDDASEGKFKEKV